MGRVVVNNISRHGQQKRNKKDAKQKPEQLKAFLRTINEELDEIKLRIVESALLNNRKT